MLRLDKIITLWKDAAALCDHINLYGFWNETTFLTKSGDLGMVLHVGGVDSTLPFVDVEVKNVILDDLRQSPYSAQIEFEKVFTNPSDHSELRREQWTASVTYVFRETVKNNELAVNPLGLTIVRFRADQAFE